MLPTRGDAVTETQAAVTETGSVHEQPWPGPGRAWYSVAVFTLVTAFAFVDRQILVLMVGPIKKDLLLTDTQISLLIGFAFVMFYVFLGIPIARLADTFSRRAIVGAGVVLWSCMTAACGLAQSFWQLFCARVGVGLGEACNGPATFSILADSFPPEKLAKAAAIISSGFFLGSGIAYIGGGAIIQKVSAGPDMVLPVIGAVRAWQFTFIVVGLPGLLLAALIATVREPARRGLMRLEHVPGRKAVPLLDIFRYMRGDWKTYLPIYAGLAFRAITAFGMAAWLPTFFARTYGWSTAQIGTAIGIVMLTASPLGLWCGGIWSEWFARQGRDDANMRVNLYSSVIGLPTIVAYPLMPTPELAIGLYALNSFLNSLSPGPANAALQTITPNQMRAQFTALYLFIFNLVGFGLGPLLIASLTDHFFHDELMLRYSMSLTGACMIPPAILVFWYGLEPYAGSVIRARARS